MRFAFDPRRPDSFPRTLCAVFPHPDDEAWGAGGLLFRAASHGTRVALITVSAGEAGRDHRTSLTGPALAAVRRRELDTAAAALGIERVEVPGLPDGDLALEPAVSAIESALSAIFGTFASPPDPEVIVTFDRDGGYPHRDHTTVVRAVEHLALTTCPAALVLGAAFPRDLLRPLRDAFVARRPELVDPSWFSLSLGRDRFDLELDLSPAEAHAKRTALMAHATQLRREGPAGADTFLGPGVFPSLCRRERYVVLRAGLS